MKLLSFPASFWIKTAFMLIILEFWRNYLTINMTWKCTWNVIKCRNTFRFGGTSDPSQTLKTIIFWNKTHAQSPLQILWWVSGGRQPVRDSLLQEHVSDLLLLQGWGDTALPGTPPPQAQLFRCVEHRRTSQDFHLIVTCVEVTKVKQKKKNCATQKNPFES